MKGSNSLLDLCLKDIVYLIFLEHYVELEPARRGKDDVSDISM